MKLTFVCLFIKTRDDIQSQCSTGGSQDTNKVRYTSWIQKVNIIFVLKLPKQIVREGVKGRGHVKA